MERKVFSYIPPPYSAPNAGTWTVIPLRYPLHGLAANNRLGSSIHVTAVTVFIEPYVSVVSLLPVNKPISLRAVLLIDHLQKPNEDGVINNYPTGGEVFTSDSFQAIANPVQENRFTFLMDKVVTAQVTDVLHQGEPLVAVPTLVSFHPPNPIIETADTDTIVDFVPATIDGTYISVRGNSFWLLLCQSEPTAGGSLSIKLRYHIEYMDI